MRYEPLEEDYARVPNMSDSERLEYFLYRIFDAEEVWGLKEDSQWLTREIDGRLTQPVWPFKRFAEDAAKDEWQDLMPTAYALEHFVYQELNKLAMQDITVEIMPGPSHRGCLITPHRLYDILEGMLEAGQMIVDD